MNNQQSQQELQATTGWRLEDIRDLSGDTWVATATTTHLRARGEGERTFAVIATGELHFAFGLHVIPGLAAWSREQEQARGLTMLYAAAVAMLDALNRFYAAEVVAPDPDSYAVVEALGAQVNIARERHDPLYDGMREPLARLVPLVRALIAAYDPAGTGPLQEALARAEPLFVGEERSEPFRG